MYAYVGESPLIESDPRGLDNPGWGAYGAHANFNVASGTLTLTAPDGTQTSYDAGNNSASTSRGPWPAGDYSYGYSTTHNDDAPDSSFGSNGNAVYNVPGCVGCAIHSGHVDTPDKLGRKGPKAAPNGCIRTTDDATKLLHQFINDGNAPGLTVVR